MVSLCHISRLAGLVVLVVLSSTGASAMAQPTAAPQGPLDREKLQAEILNLRAQRFSNLTVGALSIVVAIAGAVTSFWVGRRALVGALDQSVHEQRLKVYPGLVKTVAPLALYFPEQGSGAAKIGPAECAAMGRAVSRWYFSGGGLLLSESSRNAYFALMRALTRASLAAEISAPSYPHDALEISLEKVDQYRKQLSKRFRLDDVDGWLFGGTAAAPGLSPEERFKDYLFLQRLASTLRTTLATDLRSRRTTS